jgi:NAD+ kinase
MTGRVSGAAAKVKTAVLLSHANPAGTVAATVAAATVAERVGCRLIATSDELEKSSQLADRIDLVDELPATPDLCLVLGGDGTILRGLRTFGAAGVPVFGINFGTIGFLAALERDELDRGLELAFAGEFDVMELPGLELGVGGPGSIGLNDVSFTRHPHRRVAELAYRVNGEEIGHVRCDGLVAATPAGSTGYNLANQGPVLAWGVEGYAVSFIAPHTLTARPLVVAPADVLEVRNAGQRDAVDVLLDGQPAGELGPGGEVEVRFRESAGRLAQLPGSSFYRRMREKFGAIAQAGSGPP